jgi:Tfp pilus assembly protein PilX
MRERNKTRKMNQERGVALIFALFALLLLSAIAASLVLMTNTETAVNSNYRNERVADYAAKAGFEEVRARMRPADPNSINALLPIAPPPAGNVLYVLNEGNQPGTVQPWNKGSAYMDDELCHDGYPYNGVMQGQGQNNLASDLRCTNVPPGNGWYNTTPSNAPWSGTSAALPYKWVRVALKVNCTIQGAQNATAYCVNATAPINATQQVCWNGANEVLLPVGVANCAAMAPSANPVYVLTSLAVTGTSTRKMVQAEVALNPSQPFPYGLYATGNSCLPPALSLNGGGNSNPFTDSFTTANGGTYGTTNTPTGGDVGSNGGVLLAGHAQVGGIIGVLSSAPSPPGPASPCIGPTGDYTAIGANAGPYNPGNTLPQNQLTQLAGPVVFPPPADPVPLPPNTPYNGSSTLVPGTYGAISLTSNLTLSPGTYNIYSLNMSGQANIIVNPPGAVVLKFPSTSANPMTFSGQSILSNTGIANDLLIQYGGTGTINIAGQNASYFNLDAPLATVNVSGKGDVYGRVIGQTLNWSGNGKFHFDKASSLGPPNNGPYTLISFRDVSY